MNSRTLMRVGVFALALLAIALAVFSPQLLLQHADVAAGTLMLANAPIALPELKALVESIGQAFNEFKASNNELLKAKAEGKAVGDLEAKVAKIGEALDKFDTDKKALEDAIVTLQRPGGAGGDEKTAAEHAKELKSFNDSLRADMQAKGKPAPAEFDLASYAQYKSAMGKVLRHGNLEMLSADERKAMSVGSDPDGGWLTPAPMQGRVVSKVYEQSVMRQIATVQQLSSDSLEGITDNAESDAGWVSEIGTRNDTNTPTVAKYRIEAHEMYAQPKVTQKLLDDAAIDIEMWLAGKVADKFGRVEGLAFWRGNGSGQARGLADYTTAATGDDTRAWGQLEHVLSGANGDFGSTKADPLQDLVGAFRDYYLQNAQFVMRREVRTMIRKLKEATTDRYLWEPSLQAGQPDKLLGYPARIDQYMPALATNSLSLAFGDFREAYTIVDRLGIRVLRDPFTAKPYVRFYTTKRTGGGCVNFEAVKFIKFA